MKKSILCSSLLAALLLVGCGQVDKPNTDPNPEDKPTTQPEQKPETQPEQKPETQPEQKPETKPEEVLVTEVKFNEKKNHVSLHPDQSTYDLGAKLQVLPAEATNKTVTWSTSDESVATVDATGKVTILKRGTDTTTITATSVADPTKSATIKLKLYDVPTSFTFEVNSKPVTTLDMTVGSLVDVFEKAVTANNGLGSYYGTWTTDNEAVVKITKDKSQKLEAVAEGTCTVTYTSKYDANVKNSLTVTVKPAPVLVPGVFDFDGVGTSTITTQEWTNGNDVLKLEASNKCFGENTSLKFGTSSVAGSATFALPTGYTKVKVSLKNYNKDKATVLLNGVEHALADGVNEIVLDIPADGKLNVQAKEWTTDPKGRFYIEKLEFVK